MLVCAFNPLPKGEHQKLLIVPSFSSKSFSGKSSFLVKNSYLVTLPDYKAEIFSV